MPAVSASLNSDPRSPTVEGTARAVGWTGALSLKLARRGEATVVEHRRHVGPLQIQRAFYPEGPECCHLYLLHPPGGLVAGDSLALDVEVAGGARALITTPSATKVYRSSAGKLARQEQRFVVDSGAALEWLPQETIVFDAAEARLSTVVQLEAGAAFAGWEILCLGRPAGEVPFRTGNCGQRIELHRSGRPVIVDRTAVEGGGELAAAAFGLREQAVLGTFLASPVPAGALELLRGAAGALPAEDLLSITAMPDVLVCRYLGPSAARARAHFGRLWTLLRPSLVGRPPCPPRIWMT